MPTNRIKRSRGRTRLDYWKIDQLVTGQFLLAGVGYMEAFKHLGGINSYSASDRAALVESVRQHWQQIGSEFLAWWRGETEQFTATYASVGGKRRDPSITPWALIEFGDASEKDEA